MAIQLNLSEPAPARPRTKRDHPETSWQAARTVARTSHLKRAILDALTARPMTDSELVGWLRAGAFPHASESGIRSRRAELVEEQLVTDTGLRRLTPAGRESAVWARA
jgi:hypothetical protein